MLPIAHGDAGCGDAAVGEAHHHRDDDEIVIHAEVLQHSQADVDSGCHYESGEGCQDP